MCSVLCATIRNETAMTELAYLPELGHDIRMIFLNHLTKKLLKHDLGRLNDAEGDGRKWIPYTLVYKAEETPRISLCVFEAVTLSVLVIDVK